MLTGRRLAEKLKQLLELTKEEHERNERYNNNPGQQASSAAEMDEESSCPVSDPSTVDADLVGIDGPMADLLEQLAEEAEGGAKKQKVIAIVGFCGTGKTALAAKVYNSQVGTGTSFKEHAWVSAADKRPAEVLTQLLHKFTAGAGSSQGTSVSQDLPALQKRCKQHLMNKR
jgi:dienelactone hydrolase